MEWLQVVSVIGAILSPIFVAIIGARSEITNRNTKKIRELEAEAKAKEAKELKDELKSINASIQSVQEKLEVLDGRIEELQKHNDEQDEAIATLSQATRMNGQYVHELAQLVMVLSEGMRDQHLDGNITKAINRYRKFESDTLNQFLTGNKSYCIL